MKKSPKRLLFLVVSVVALALVVAPVSFAGEDDPGPTQAGEVQGPSQGDSPANQQGPGGAPVAATQRSGGSPASTTEVLGATETSTATTGTTSTQDVVKAQGGIQAGFGGMATQATSTTSLTGLVAAVLALGAALVLVPFRRRTQE
jgi:hypothetical protein